MSDPLYDPFPKYLQIREILMRRLRMLNAGDRLPTEAELAAEFQVSRVTIRQVLDRLAEEGIIARRPRLGTTLLRPPSTPIDNRLTGPIEEFATLGITTETRLAGRSVIPAPPEIAAALSIPPSSPCYEIQRVRFLDGIPLLLLEAFLTVAAGRMVARRGLRGGLIVPALREVVDPGVREEYQQVDAISAGAAMARQLKIEPGDPILCLKRLFVDSAGRPVVFFKVNFRADRYYYTVKLPQPARGSRPRAVPSASKHAIRKRPASASRKRPA
jgi:GntR family transcriptional regulator